MKRSLPIDHWDMIGAIGTILIGVSLWSLTRPEWAGIFWGAILLSLYVLRELRAMRGR
jgi:hypothetical protein